MDTQAARSVPTPASAQPLRFAVLRHEGHGPLHYDLLLEFPDQDRLVTFQLLAPPDAWTPGTTHSARRLPNHRRIYLNYEGPISQNRGHVTRILQGTWTPTNPPYAGTLHTASAALSFRLEKSPTSPIDQHTGTADIDNYQLLITSHQ